MGATVEYSATVVHSLIVWELYTTKMHYHVPSGLLSGSLLLAFAAGQCCRSMLQVTVALVRNGARQDRPAGEQKASFTKQQDALTCTFWPAFTFPLLGLHCRSQQLIVRNGATAKVLHSQNNKMH